MSAAVTRWFSPKVTPVHIGVYEVRPKNRDEFSGFQYWDGKLWRFWGYSPKDAHACKLKVSIFQNNYWRGLAEKPSR